MSEDLGWLQDMLDSARHARDHVAGMSAEEFIADVKSQDSAIRRLEMIGEAATHVSAATRDSIDVPWQDIIAQRHVVVHHYRKLVMPRIWRTIHEDLPPLIQKLDHYLAGQP
jgi:uncharacterized protein with HEPN domain